MRPILSFSLFRTCSLQPEIIFPLATFLSKQSMQAIDWKEDREQHLTPPLPQQPPPPLCRTGLLIGRLKHHHVGTHRRRCLWRHRRKWQQRSFYCRNWGRKIINWQTIRMGNATINKTDKSLTQATPSFFAISLAYVSPIHEKEL